MARPVRATLLSHDLETASLACYSHNRLATAKRTAIVRDRADTRWYRIDKVTPLDHQEPPERAHCQDPLGRVRMCSSKLVVRLSLLYQTSPIGTMSLFFGDLRKVGLPQKAYTKWPEVCRAIASDGS